MMDPYGIPQHAPGAKLDANKPQARLIIHGMPRALLAVIAVADYGAKKYTTDGWRTVPNAIPRYTDAMLRHLLAEGMEQRDPESGLLHAAHAAWNALARLELMLLDDDLWHAARAAIREHALEVADAD
jgi:hypothetical protein